MRSVQSDRRTHLGYLLNSGNLASDFEADGQIEMTAEQELVSPVGRTSQAASRRRAGRSAEHRAEHDRLAPYEALARMIIARRIRYRLTQELLAERMGTSVSAISRLESGQHRPSLATLEKVARAFQERIVVGFEDENGKSEPCALLG